MHQNWEANYRRKKSMPQSEIKPTTFWSQVRYQIYCTSRPGQNVFQHSYVVFYQTSYHMIMSPACLSGKVCLVTCRHQVRAALNSIFYFILFFLFHLFIYLSIYLSIYLFFLAGMSLGKPDKNPTLVLIIPRILGQATLEAYPSTDNTKDPWASHSRTLF